MAHTIHTTDAFVISEKDRGETSKLITIFTKDFGLLGPRAQGVRKVDSKLRQGLRPYSFVEISLVSGKGGWRIVDVFEQDPLLSVHLEKELLETLARFSLLLTRLLGTEVKQEKLFSDMRQAITLMNEKKLTKDQLFRLEILLAVKLLLHLGYMPKHQTSQKSEHISSVARATLNEDVLSEIAGQEREYIRAINESINDTQL